MGRRTMPPQSLWTPGGAEPDDPNDCEDDGRGIELGTRANRHINNNQCHDALTGLMQWEYQDLVKKYPLARLRTGPSTMYNCHGLAFAGRRAEINDSSAIPTILREDRYDEVEARDALPGDLVIYYNSENGDAEHSGIVVSPPDLSIAPVPQVVSKWGKGPEYLHAANHCPYNYGGAKYYRIQQ